MHCKYSLYARRALVALLNAMVLVGAVSAAAARQTASSNPPPKLQPPVSASTPQKMDLDRFLKEWEQAFNKADFTLAEQAAKAGLDKARYLPNQEYTAKFLGCLLNEYYVMGQFDKALDCGSQALVIRQALGSQPKIAATLNNLSAVYLKLGQFEKALDCGSRALVIMENLDGPQNLASTLRRKYAVVIAKRRLCAILPSYSLWRQKLCGAANLARLF